jgi:hypothetical protein
MLNNNYFLENLGLVVTKSNLPIEFVKNVWMKRLLCIYVLECSLHLEKTFQTMLC